MLKTHACEAILLSCLDWRLHSKVEECFRKKYGNLDLCITAGALSGLLENPWQDYLLKQIETSQKLHDSKIIILTMHRDCGAFGGSAKFQNKKDEFLHHQKILKQMGQVLSKKFPKSKIVKYFIDLEFKKDKWIPLVKSVK